MFIWGRVVGALLGIAGGPFGIAFGFLVGFLVDQAIGVRRTQERFKAYFTGADGLGPDALEEVYAARAALATYCAAENGILPASARSRLQSYLSEMENTRHGRRRADTVIEAAEEALSLLAWRELAHTLCEEVPREERAAFAGFVWDLCDREERPIPSANRARLQQVTEALEPGEEVARALSDQHRKLDPAACAIIGVSTTATREEIRRVYRKLAGHFHPDASTGLEEHQRLQAAEAFVRIHAAYETLMQQTESDQT